MFTTTIATRLCTVSVGLFKIRTYRSHRTYCGRNQWCRNWYFDIFLSGG